MFLLARLAPTTCAQRAYENLGWGKALCDRHVPGLYRASHLQVSSTQTESSITWSILAQMTEVLKP